MSNYEINCLYDARNVMEIYLHPGHDLWVNTAHRNTVEPGKYEVGQNVRIYNYQGSALFDLLNVQFLKVTDVADKLVLDDVLDTPVPSIDIMDAVSLIDYVADESVLTVYRNQMGDIGLKTGHARRDNIANGPVVWLAGPVNENSNEILKARAEIFAPLFDLTKYVADRFNLPKPERF